jgi:predicted PurR-regulated permease PerM
LEVVALIFSILALVVGAVVAYQLMQLLNAIKTLTEAADAMAGKIDSLDQEVKAQGQAIDEMKKAKALPAKAGDFAHLVSELTGPGRIPAIAALGMKFFAAYWKKRQESKTGSVENQLIDGPKRNALPAKGVSKSNAEPKEVKKKK